MYWTELCCDIWLFSVGYEETQTHGQGGFRGNGNDIRLEPLHLEP